jgi:hypothetical protein
MSQYRRYRAPVRQSTKALTAKLAALAIVATLLIGGLIATQMAAGNDPALGPKAVAKAKKANKANSNTGSSTSSSSGTDPYTQKYGDDGYSYGSSGSSGYSSGSGGYSSGYSTQQSSPAPVTSSTS